PLPLFQRGLIPWLVFQSRTDYRPWNSNGSPLMAVPGHQAIAIGTYLFKQRLKGKKRYPLNLMLEPLFRCNLACPGCGKIQFPDEILKKNLSVEQALAAAEECGAPMVTIPGGEP